MFFIFHHRCLFKHEHCLCLMNCVNPNASWMSVISTRLLTQYDTKEQNHCRQPIFLPFSNIYTVSTKFQLTFLPLHFMSGGHWHNCPQLVWLSTICLEIDEKNDASPNTFMRILQCKSGVITLTHFVILMTRVSPTRRAWRATLNATRRKESWTHNSNKRPLALVKPHAS